MENNILAKDAYMSLANHIDRKRAIDLVDGMSLEDIYEEAYLANPASEKATGTNFMKGGLCSYQYLIVIAIAGASLGHQDKIYVSSSPVFFSRYPFTFLSLLGRQELLSICLYQPFLQHLHLVLSG